MALTLLGKPWFIVRI